MTRSAPEHFDAISGRYAASEIHADSPTIRRLHELLGPEPLGSICDVACGPGHLALSFAGKASRIVGVDAAPNMLRQFERMARERGLAVEAVRAYAEEMPLPSKSFDVVMSRLAPHHFADPTRAVREMARLAKPGGRAAVIDLDGNEDPCLDDLMTQNKIQINRAPVLTLWASVVAERLGFKHDEALSLGKALASLNAQSKGQRLGIFKTSPKELKRCGNRNEVRNFGWISLEERYRP